MAVLLPNLFTIVFNLHYLVLYLKANVGPFNRFLTFPLLQMLGSAYCLIVTAWKVLAQELPFAYSEVPVMGLPVLYAVVYWGLAGGKLCSEERWDGSRSILSSKAVEDLAEDYE